MKIIGIVLLFLFLVPVATACPLQMFPHMVKFTIVDNGNFSSEETVTVSPVAETYSSAIFEMFGIFPVNTAIGDPLVVYTDNGTVVLPLFKAVKYNVTITNSDGDHVFFIYPRESDYIIWVWD